jgi:arsenate reductase
MEPITIYHNPACGSSRGALALLKQHGAEPEIIEYLKNPPGRAALEGILAILDAPPSEMVRKDKRFKELGLDPQEYTSPASIVGLLLAHPELMQRPIVIRGKRAIIARPPDKLTALL